MEDYWMATVGWGPLQGFGERMKWELDRVKLPAGTEFVVKYNTILFRTGIELAIPTAVQKAIILCGGTSKF